MTADGRGGIGKRKGLMFGRLQVTRRQEDGGLAPAIFAALARPSSSALQPRVAPAPVLHNLTGQEPTAPELPTFCLEFQSRFCLNMVMSLKGRMEDTEPAAWHSLTNLYKGFGCRLSFQV